MEKANYGDSKKTSGCQELQGGDTQGGAQRISRTVNTLGMLS